MYIHYTGNITHYNICYCLLSLWRVVRGSKLMHLDLIHVFFYNLNIVLGYQQHSYPAIIIMHMYNWYLSNTTDIHYVHEHRLRVQIIPLLLAFLHSLLLPIRTPFTYLEPSLL